MIYEGSGNMKCPYCIKVCKACNRLLVAYNNNFYKDKKGKYGLSCKCKVCVKKKTQKYYYDNRDDVLIKRREYSEENKEKIKEYKKQYYINNKDEINEKKKQYYEENKESILEKNKQYYEENKEDILDKCKQYRENHKEEISEYKKRWYEENPEKVFNSHTRRRENENGQGMGITKDQWLEMMDFFEWRCAYSGIKFSSNNKDKDRSIDHINPLDKGGENEIWNVVPMYLNYNKSKNTRDMFEWYEQQEFYSEERLTKIYEWIEYARNKWDVN